MHTPSISSFFWIHIIFKMINVIRILTITSRFINIIIFMFLIFSVMIIFMVILGVVIIVIIIIIGCILNYIVFWYLIMVVPAMVLVLVFIIVVVVTIVIIVIIVCSSKCSFCASGIMFALPKWFPCPLSPLRIPPSSMYWSLLVALLMLSPSPFVGEVDRCLGYWFHLVPYHHCIQYSYCHLDYHPFSCPNSY